MKQPLFRRLGERLLLTLGFRPRDEPQRSFELDGELYQALQEVADQQQRTTGDLAQEMIYQGLAQDQDQEALLALWRDFSLREQEVVAMICQGYTNAEIAHRLGLAMGTVKTHVRTVLTRCGLKNRKELRKLFSYWDFTHWEQG